jgi:hypothetical protein
MVNPNTIYDAFILDLALSPLDPVLDPVDISIKTTEAYVTDYFTFEVDVN